MRRPHTLSQVITTKIFCVRLVTPSLEEFVLLRFKGTLHAPEGVSGVQNETSNEGSALHAMPAPSDDDVDAILDTDADIEVEVVGDEEYIPGPDYYDEDDVFGEVETEPGVGFSPVPIDTNSTFAQILRSVIVQLAKWVKENDALEMDNAERPMTFGYFSILSRVSVDFLVALYLPEISPEVQVLFVKETWSVEDILSLPLADDKRQGIYGNFAAGAIRHRTDFGCEVYIGSSHCLEKQIRDHLRMAANYAVHELPDKHKRSFDYRQICRDEVQANARRSVAFNLPVETGYFLLLEGIFTILFGTYNYPGYTSSWATQFSYKLVSGIRESLKLPDAPWRGMNAALLLLQGFFNRLVKSPSPCSDPSYDRMTYPRAFIPEGEGLHTREHRNPENLLGPYLCGICFRYRHWHGELPDGNVLAKYAQCLQTREEAGENDACEMCGRLESQFAGKELLLRKGE